MSIVKRLIKWGITTILFVLFIIGGIIFLSRGFIRYMSDVSFVGIFTAVAFALGLYALEYGGKCNNEKIKKRLSKFSVLLVLSGLLMVVAYISYTLRYTEKNNFLEETYNFLLTLSFYVLDVFSIFLFIICLLVLECTLLSDIDIHSKNKKTLTGKMKTKTKATHQKAGE